MNTKNIDTENRKSLSIHVADVALDGIVVRQAVGIFIDGKLATLTPENAVKMARSLHSFARCVQKLNTERIRP